MNAQIAAVTDKLHDRIGHRANADLQNCPILDEFGSKTRNRLVRFARTERRDHDRVAVYHDRHVDLVRSQRPRAHGARNTRVDFGDHDTRTVDQCPNMISDQAHAVSAMGICRADLNERHVACQFAPFHHRTDLPDMAGHDPQNARLCQTAQAAQRSHAAETDSIGVVRFQQAGKARRGEQRDSAQFCPLRNQGFQKGNWLPAGLPRYDGVTRTNIAAQVQAFRRQPIGH